MKHYMTLFDGKKITIKQYIAAYKLAKTNPNRDFDRSFSGWWPVKGEEICRQFREGVHERINRNDERKKYRNYNK